MKRVAILLSALLVTLGASADSIPRDSTEYNLNEVIVTGTNMTKNM